MFPIAAVDYANSIRIFKERKYKAVVFFLYEQSSLSSHYSYELAVHSEEINSITGNYIAFLTHHAVKSDISKDYIFNDDFPIGRGFINWDRNNIEKELRDNNMNSDPYFSMRNVAKAFRNGMENRLPCFVILNPNEPEFFVEKSAKGINPEDIFKSIAQIFLDIQVEKYNIHNYADKHKYSYYCLPAHELLERNLNSIKYGIHVKELKEIILNEELEDVFDFNEINELSENGYIPADKFFERFIKIKCKDIDFNKDLEKSALVSLLEKYASFHSNKYPQKTMMFREIKEHIEPSSIDYLAVATMFKRRNNKDLEVSSSMIAICLGKVVEDELNLGIFNVFRGAFSVSLPEYFNKIQTGIGELQVRFKSCKNPIRFNGRDRMNSCKLDYPIVSDLKKIAFGDSCLPTDNINNVKKAANARNDIINIKRELGIDNNWDHIFANLTDIAETRNKAIHKAQPLNKDDLKKCENAFRELVNMRFFEVNDKLKDIKRN